MTAFIVYCFLCLACGIKLYLYLGQSKMKEFVWKWLFWASLVFCFSLALSLCVAYLLYNTAPHNEYTPLFASGFGFAVGFFGLGGIIFFLFDRLSNMEPILKEVENEFFNKVLKELPFLFFALLYFFSLALYVGLFLLILTYIKNSCV